VRAVNGLRDRAPKLVRGLQRALRQADRRLPLLAKLAVPTVVILGITWAMVSSILVVETRRHFTEAYDEQALLVTSLVAAQYQSNPEDSRAMGAFLEDLRRSAPALLRVRVYRLQGGQRMVWASSQSLLHGEGALPERNYPVGVPEAPAWVGLVVSSRALDRAVADAQRDLLANLALGGAAALALVALVVYSFVLRRSGRLSRAARRVAEGDLTVALPEGAGPPSRDALLNVAREFDRMLHALAARNRQQAAVAELGQLALAGGGEAALLDTAVRLVAEGLDAVAVSALRVEANRLVAARAAGWPPSRVGSAEPQHGQAAYTLRTSGPVVSDDLEAEDRFDPGPAILGRRFRSSVSVIVPGATEPYGVLLAHAEQPARFSPDDVHFLQAMANGLGSALRHRLAQEELADAEERYRVLVEQIPAVVYIDEDDETCTARYVSPQYERMLGYTPEERLADPELWLKLLHPDDRERVMAEDTASRAAGRPFQSEYRMVARDGRVVWVRDHALPYRDETGRILGWQGVMFDVSEEKRAEETLRRVVLQNTLILESAGEGIFGLDGDGRITFINPAATSMLAWTADELIGRLGHEVIHHSRTDGSPYPLDECPIYAAFRDGETRRVDDEVFWRRDGTPLPVEYTSTPLRDEGRLAGAVVTFSDITERKSAQETLRAAYDREREAVERLQQVDSMKNAFLSAVSHELRTPLSAVMGYALTLRQEEMQLPPEERRELLERLAVNAQKLQRLLADLLDVDRMERGILEPRRHPIDLESLITRVVGETDVRGRAVELDVEPVTAEIDGPKVERIVENLLVNAAKHTPPNTRVRLAVRKREGGVLLSVEDQGAGVPDELKEAVFRPFERGPRAPTHAPGTGIGLSLVARFAELHGGRAWVEDGPDGGAVFRVFLPAVISSNGDGDLTAPGPERHAPRAAR
jgi:PAS domain S-box-containing protein